MTRPDYASDEVINKIRTWDVTDGSWHALLVFMDDNWPEYGCVRRPTANRWEFVTGGWSGCEEIIIAFMDNSIAMSMLWESSHRGGLHVLVEPSTAPATST
jgi:aromatic ring-cleaving dioxygenase